MLIRNKKGSSLLPLAVVFLALTCFALSAHAAVEEVVLSNVAEDPRDLCAFLQVIVNIKNLALMIGGPITALMIVIGGIWMSASSGLEPQIKKAKQIITSGIVGLVIVLCAWLIVGGIITAMFGSSLGNGWWTIKGCNAVDTSTPYTGDNQDGDDQDNDTPSGDPSQAKDPTECRKACVPFSASWDYENESCTCVKGENDPDKATNAENCAIACLPQRSYWDIAHEHCQCTGQGSLNYDPDAAPERLGRTGRSFFDCIESFYLYPDTATIWRIGDHNFDCYDEDKWNDEGCIFEKYSCHYGGRNCRGESYAADFSNITNKTLFKAAVIQCGGAPPAEKGSYIHVRFESGCMCSDDI